MTSPSHDDGPRHGHDHGHGHDHHALGDLLDLDAAVLQRYWSDVMTWVHSRAPERPVRRVLDVGAGTGAGTIALAARFPDAGVVAVDMSPEMLERVQKRAAIGGRPNE